MPRRAAQAKIHIHHLVNSFVSAFRTGEYVSAGLRHTFYSEVYNMYVSAGWTYTFQKCIIRIHKCISGEQIHVRFLLRNVSYNMLWVAGYAHFWHTPLTPYQLPVCMSGANSSIWYLLRIFISAFGVYHRSPHRLWWYLSTTSGVELPTDFLWYYNIWVLYIPSFDIFYTL